MCRSIKTLRSAEAPASTADIDAAALQFVRKVSGYNKPSRKNEEAFYAAVSEISEASRKLLESLTTSNVAARA